MAMGELNHMPSPQDHLSPEPQPQQDTQEPSGFSECQRANEARQAAMEPIWEAWE